MAGEDPLERAREDVGVVVAEEHPVEAPELGAVVVQVREGREVAPRARGVNALVGRRCEPHGRHRRLLPVRVEDEGIAHADVPRPRLLHCGNARAVVALASQHAVHDARRVLVEARRPGVVIRALRGGRIRGRTRRRARGRTRGRLRRGSMRHISRLGLGRGVVDSRRIVETRGRGSRPAVGERAEDECPEAEAAGEKGKLTAKPPPPRCRAYWCVPESSFAFTCWRAKHGPASTRRRSDLFAERLARRRENRRGCPLLRRPVAPRCRRRPHPLFAVQTRGGKNGQPRRNG